MTDEELAEKVGRALYIERPLELDQEGGDDWDILPEEWREEWIDAGRVAVAAVKKARRLTRPRPQRSGDPVHWAGEPGQGPTSLHGNGATSFARTSGDEDEVTCKLCLTLLARGEHCSGDLS